MAGNHAAVEPDAKLLVVLRLGLNLDRRLVMLLQVVEFAIESDDGKPVHSVWFDRIFRPPECLERILAGSITCPPLRSGHEVLEVLHPFQPLPISCVAFLPVPYGEAAQSGA